jgi:hypothetical protein
MSSNKGKFGRENRSHLKLSEEILYERWTRFVNEAQRPDLGLTGSCGLIQGT